MNKFNRVYYNKILKEADSKNGHIGGYIALGGLHINELPDFFKDLTVETLDLSENNISSLDGITGEVRHLIINSNAIRFIPDMVFRYFEFRNLPKPSVTTG
jgi:Leucine-rich repeat (LRR) protein